MSKQRARAQLQSMQVRPSKQRGQNFVVQPFVIDDIVRFGEFHSQDTIVEIGPGMGALTEELAAAQSLSLVEIEPAFCAELERKFPHARVYNEDVRTFDFSQIGSDLVVFGNLPYVFSTEIVFHLLEHRQYIRKAVLLLQKEFAARVAADPGSRTYGVLSIMVQLWCNAALGPVIPGTAFHPPTKVESQVLVLEFRDTCSIQEDVVDMFELVVRLAFMQRRKKLFNSLKKAKHFSPQVLEEAFAASGISPDVRAEALSIEEFEGLAKEIKSRVLTLS